ncbi:hypothetical protein OGATHE_000398 [Ogataea polymorpha]|uniref:Uncharacterized protein n=1 Tax=Ogataea polymorpha TaxID=460523 RepID=A0A9P8PUZ1_9ASCO|nr:hypothetical protein OGATHE_000398 [Ogataea polymorpha]
MAAAFLMTSLATFTVSSSLKESSLLNTDSGDSVASLFFKEETNGMAFFISFPSMLALISLLSSSLCSSKSLLTSSTLVDQRVHLIIKGLIKEIVLAGSERANGFDRFISPFPQCVHSQNGCIGVALLEIGVFNAVTCICESNSRSVGSKFLHHLLQGHEITGRLRHLGIIQHQVSIASNPFGPELLLEQGSMAVDEESQVVWNQVFPRHRHVCWVEVLKLSSHQVQMLLRNAAVDLVRVAENIIPDLVGHLFWLDTKGTKMTSDSGSLIFANDHGTIVETLLVGQFLSRGQRNGVFGRVNLQLLDKILCAFVTVLFCPDDREDVGDDPILINSVEVGLIVQVSSRSIIVWRVGRNTRNHARSLGLQDGLHRKHSQVLKHCEWSINLGTYQRSTVDLQYWLEVSSPRSQLLVAHVLERSLGANVVVPVSGVKQTIVDFWRNETARLAVHGFRSQSGCHQKHLFASRIKLLVFKNLLCFSSKLGDPNLQSSVLLRQNSLSRLSVVIHTWLAVFDGVNGVSFTELDFALLSQPVHLPSNKRIVVAVEISRDHRSSPINLTSKSGDIFLNKRREKSDPVVRVSKFRDLGSWNPKLLHDLKLVFSTALLGLNLGLLGIEFGHIFLLGGCLCLVVGLFVFCRHLREVFTKHLDLSLELVGSSTDRHSCTVESKRENHLHALQSLERGLTGAAISDSMYSRSLIGSVGFSNVLRTSVVLLEAGGSSFCSTGFAFCKKDGKNSVSTSSSSSFCTFKAGWTVFSSSKTTTGGSLSVASVIAWSSRCLETGTCSSSSSSLRSTGLLKSKESIQDSIILVVRSFSSTISFSVSPMVKSVFTFSTV